MFQETQEPKLACEVAKKLVQRHDLQLNMLEADGHFFYVEAPLEGMCGLIGGLRRQGSQGGGCSTSAV